MSDENKQIQEPAREADLPFSRKESGQIEPMKSVQAPLPTEPGRGDDDD